MQLKCCEKDGEQLISSHGSLSSAAVKISCSRQRIPLLVTKAPGLRDKNHRNGRTVCHFDQSLRNSSPKQLPTSDLEICLCGTEQQAQGHIQGEGHCRVLIPFSEKELFLEMLTARTCIQCFSVYKEEGDKFPVFFSLFLSEFWCQSMMLIPELGAERGQGTGETPGGCSGTTGLSMGISTDSLADQGIQLGKRSSLHPTCNCLYFVIYLV